MPFPRTTHQPHAILMSSPTNSGSDPADPQAEQCDHENCDEVYDTTTTATSPFCSRDCIRRAKAWGLLKHILKDRRYCANCYRQIRDVEEPGRLMRSRKVIARTYYREKPHLARPIRTKDPNDPHGRFREDVPSNATTWEVSGPDTSDDTACKCGCTDHDTVNRPVDSQTLMDYGKRLADVANAVSEDRDYPYRIDRDEFLDSVRARKTDPANHQPDQRILEHAMADALE